MQINNKTPCLSNKKIIIASYTHRIHEKHTAIGGPALSLMHFLKDKVSKLVCIWQPVAISDDLSVLMEVYEKDKDPVTRRFPMVDWPFNREKEISELYFILKIRDLAATLYFTISLREHFDYFIGIESLNAIIGLILRKVGIVNKVIYYNLDYGELRFKNKAMNFIFHVLDKFCVSHADCVWNLSPAMAEVREKLGIKKENTAPQITVPIGTRFEEIQRLPLESIDKTCLVYLGLLHEKQGVQLIIEALPEIVRRAPDTKLVVIGSGPLEDKLKGMVKDYALEDRVEFLGVVEDEVVEKTLTKCSIGLAPYFGDSNSTKRYTDVTKPRMYMACGLPVVITRVPPVAKEIEINRAGIAIEYNKEELAEAVLRLLTDANLYRE